LLDYADLVASEEEEEEEVVDDEYDSNAEISDYPLTDPDSIGSCSSADGERLAGSGSEAAFNDSDELRLWADPCLASPPRSKVAADMQQGEEGAEEVEDEEGEEDEDESVNWFAVSSNAEDEPTVIDGSGWHRHRPHL
jgi:hypothetical protein